MDSQYYVYKMSTDSGAAPCISRGKLSLAICKPAIRRTALPGALLFGFGTKNQGEKLIYIARVSERLPGRQYYPQSAKRDDAIYEWRNGAFRLRSDAQYHYDGDHRATDVGVAPGYRNAWILISTDFCYWGCKASQEYQQSFPAVAGLVSRLSRGHRVNHDHAVRRQLIALAARHLDGSPRKIGNPRDANDDGCTVCRLRPTPVC